MRLTAQNLGWSPRRGRAVVSDVNLEVMPGETLGLIGPNGSGKSTLLRLLAGLLRGAVGRVALDGTDLRQMPRRQIAQVMAVVEQHTDTTEALRARDVVELGRTPFLSALSPFSTRDAAIVSDALETVGMIHLADAQWSTLSGGERQRIQIARALAQQPRILLLDEPTNHLDIHHQLALLRLVDDLPVTVVIALHDLNQAMGCDRLAVMEGGRMVALGPPAEVLTPDRLHSIFRIDSHRLTDPTDAATIFRFLPLEKTA
ncbi:MAG: ABC transporter ATP-binding protein [Paracoccus sp. (in: a-proteobacteria)]|uniref:ABC transporter ATP-binding protein n=1 Tax=Paracoccus sp. TaxID=267 RepID=UPI0026DF38C4|nr:ABC transporter ATP-binding protein [Paracoccus sp. (in: a-proteobacteria)]MDO5614480.1 ABC transporter ATP-binding protein [Paracoccus sp. (in: a-proteobacteria)]